MISLFQALKVGIKLMLKRKNFYAKELRNKKYKPKIIKPKKGKGSYSRKNTKA